MRIPPFWDWQAVALCLGLYVLLLPFPGNLAHGIEGFDGFREFNQIYEPSGVIQLADESFVVVED